MSTNTTTQPGDADSFQKVRVPEIYTIQLAISLCTIICLAALASFSLAPYFLVKMPQLTQTTQLTQKKLTSSKANPSSQNGANICPTNPQAINYQQPPVATPPAAWSKIGLTSQDLTRAQICAEAFTSTYETFNIKQATSLTAVTSMLSTNAKTHFFTGTRTEPKDPHADATWLAQAKKDQLQQSATLLKAASLQTAVKTSQSNSVSASFIVTCQLITKISSRSSTKQQQVLVYVAQTSVGWQVIDWKVI